MNSVFYMANYITDGMRRLRSGINSRYFSDVASGMENLGSDIRYVVLPVALGAFLKSFNDSSIPDNMVTGSLANPAYAFGAGEALRSVGYTLREMKGKSLTPLKTAGALVRAATPFWLGYNVSDGSEGARKAMADTFPPMVAWGLGHATETKSVRKS